MVFNLKSIFKNNFDRISNSLMVIILSVFAMWLLLSYQRYFNSTILAVIFTVPFIICFVATYYLINFNSKISIILAFMILIASFLIASIPLSLFGILFSGMMFGFVLYDKCELSKEN